MPEMTLYDLLKTVVFALAISALFFFMKGRGTVSETPPVATEHDICTVSETPPVATEHDTFEDNEKRYHKECFSEVISSLCDFFAIDEDIRNNHYGPDEFEYHVMCRRPVLFSVHKIPPFISDENVWKYVTGKISEQDIEDMQKQDELMAIKGDGNDDSHMDMWFPDSMNCKICEGYKNLCFICSNKSRNPATLCLPNMTKSCTNIAPGLSSPFYSNEKPKTVANKKASPCKNGKHLRPCKDGKMCKREGCTFAHKCSFGKRCRDPSNCKFEH
jgi:hypothetical protein